MHALFENVVGTHDPVALELILDTAAHMQSVGRVVVGIDDYTRAAVRCIPASSRHRQADCTAGMQMAC